MCDINFDLRHLDFEIEGNVAVRLVDSVNLVEQCLYRELDTVP